MKKNKKIYIGLMLIIISLICSQINIFAKHITNNELIEKKIDDETTLISGFEIGTKVSEILSNCFSSEYTVKVFDSKNNDITEQIDKKIGTGYNIKLYNDDTFEKEYRVVLYGDTNGDGNIGAVDALAIVKNKTGTNYFKKDIFVEAGRIQHITREEEKVPASGDALYIVKHRLYPDKYPINQKLVVNNQEEDGRYS